MKLSGHIDKVMHKIGGEEVLKHRLRLKTTIMVVKQLALQGSSFRGHDESDDSLNPGNVLAWIGFAAKLNDQINSVVLRNAPGNAKYTSPSIQKEILGIIANRVRCKICEEIGDSCFSILVDEAVDEAGREQMSIILRYVSSSGIVTERFFALKSVADTSAETLKQAICGVLSRYDLQIEKLRGQGYDGASNMSGQFNGVKALFLRDCPYAYFVHCFAHRLQLALITSAKVCDPIWDFFSILDCIINVVKASPKRIRELQAIRKKDLDGMLDAGEIQSGQGANQMTSLKRSGPTRWGSHYQSILSIINMFNATCVVLEDLCRSKEGEQRAQARGASKSIKTFEFVFNLHLMKGIMDITDFLCQAFQQESVDIVVAVGFVSMAKVKLQKLRDEGWDKLLQEVKSFCSKHAIEVPNMNATLGRGEKQTTLEHRYHFEYFNQCIDFQLGTLNSRFNESSVRLLQLSGALDPKSSFRSFDEENIYRLAEEFYPRDFEGNEMNCLKNELGYYADHVVHSQEYDVSSLAKLLEKLVETGMVARYRLICRLIRLVLTLPVSTATTERSFSAVKHVKTDLRNKMGDEFLADRLTIFFEREYVIGMDEDSIIDEFAKLKDRRVQLTL
ncbi:unnamed protein product [Linum tenue]|uniref:Zinc finger MYM-type protein 1-like n=1 Tax=Linum tenue TaxID=586396 RepID=A0AAV0NN70_9ROSI|nr:unnamed protein product [Linum tenue]